jgi:hypothetical protein
LFNNEDSPVYNSVKEYTNIIFIKNNFADIKNRLDNLKICQFNDANYSINDFSWKKRSIDYLKVLKNLYENN